MIHILSWTTKKHQKTLSRPLHSKLKKIQGLFKDLHRNLRTFQGKMEFKDFSRTSPKIQGLFKTVWTLFYTIFGTEGNLPKKPFLLTPRHWRRFVKRNICVSATEIPLDTDEVKSVWNPIISAICMTEELHCYSYCLWKTDKRQKAKKVKCKCDESIMKQSIFVEYILL